MKNYTTKSQLYSDTKFRVVTKNNKFRVKFKKMLFWHYFGLDEPCEYETLQETNNAIKKYKSNLSEEGIPIEDMQIMFLIFAAGAMLLGIFFALLCELKKV